MTDKTIPREGQAQSAGPQAETVRSDADLLQAYVQQADERAFAALVQRHGGLVWKVCRGLLHEAHDAEDAFQATFLVLVRQAARIKKPELLANWLYGVAVKVSMRLRSQGARRHRQEGQDIAMIAAVAAPAAEASDVEPILHEEVERLPERFRGAIVMCYLEGKTNEQAAEALGCPVGTVKGWLSRAREILKRRMTRRGIVFPAAWLATEVTGHAALPAVPADLMEMTSYACARWSSANTGTPVLPNRVVGLADEVLRGLQRRRSLTVAAIVVACSAFVLAAAIVGGLALYAWHHPPKTDFDRLRGSWQQISMKKDGVEQMVVDGPKSMRWIFSDEELFFAAGDQKLAYRFTIDPKKSPKIMDTVRVDPVKGQVGQPWRWIYECDGATLKIAIPELPNTVRPTTFEGAAGSKSMVFVFKRPAEPK